LCTHVIPFHLMNESYSEVSSSEPSELCSLHCNTETVGKSIILLFTKLLHYIIGDF
jgi:hypothetical protein